MRLGEAVNEAWHFWLVRVAVRWTGKDRAVALAKGAVQVALNANATQTMAAVIRSRKRRDEGGR